MQLEEEEELSLGTSHWEVLPVLRDFVILSQLQQFLRNELILWDAEGHQVTDL